MLAWTGRSEVSSERDRRVVNCRPVALANALNDWLRGQDRDTQAIPPMMLLYIASRRPLQQFFAPYQITGALDLHKTTVRQRIQRCFPGDLFSSTVNSRPMQFPIDFGREQRPAFRLARTIPGISEGVEPFPPALGTRPVSGGQRHRFVQKEQLGVTARRHHGTSPPLEFQQACDPLPTPELTDDQTFVIVQRPAPVAHQSSAGSRFDNRPARIDTVL
jgi:hypothetical protein